MGENSYTTFNGMAITETFIFYDRPILFTAQDADGQLYLVQLHDEDDSDPRIETWMYVAISPERLAMVKTGEIDLYDAFKLPKDGLARWWKHGTGVNYGGISRAKFLADDDLPLRGERLSD